MKKTLHNHDYTAHHHHSRRRHHHHHHHHHVVRLTTGPYPRPKQVLQEVRSSSSSFNFQFPLVSLRPSSSCLRFVPRLPVTSILPYIFSSITCFRRQFLRKKLSILLSFLLFTVCRMFLSSSTLFNTSFLTCRSNRSSPSLSRLHSAI